MKDTLSEIGKVYVTLLSLMGFQWRTGFHGLSVVKLQLDDPKLSRSLGNHLEKPH